METRNEPMPPRGGAHPTGGVNFAGVQSGNADAQERGRSGQGDGNSGERSDAEADLGRRARGFASDAVDNATAAADSVRERAADMAGRQQQHAADTVDAMADSLRRTADTMPDDQAWLSDLAVRGGRQLSDFAETLRQNDLQGLLRRVDGFARNQPALFLGASMAAGFALARVAQVSVGHSAASSRGRPAPRARTTVTEGPDFSDEHVGATARSPMHREIPNG